MKQLSWLGLALSSACWCATARADLGSDVQALMSARAAFGSVLRLKPRLLERGDRLPLSIAPELLDPKSSSCVTITILGVPEAHFVIRFSELDPGAPSTAYPEASAAGAMEVTRCGSSKPYLAGMVLEMRSPREVLETLVSSAPAGVPKLAELLVGRDPGTELALGELGERPVAAPLAQRLQRLAERARRDGAIAFQREQWEASADGSGAGPLSLTAGCHELTLLAEPAPANAEAPIDLDIELVDAESGARLAVDRADDADASVTWCTGESVAVELRFVGSAPGAPLSLVHARWSLPEGLPKAWGPEARAKLGQLARAQHVRLPNGPLYESLGVQGTTQLPLEVEPDACYTALLAPLRGDERNLSLSVFARIPGERARGAADADGSAVSFCAHGATRALLEVGGEGSNLTWLLAVWETGRAPLGSDEP
jgi:hypothetical protein